MPFVSPGTTIGEPEPVAVIPPGEEVTVYEVMGELPGLAGGVNETVAEPMPAEAVTPVGASGGMAAVGVVGFEGVLAGPVPVEFVAVTVNV